MNKSFFLKVSKGSLVDLSAKQKVTRPRAMQVYLALLYWTQRNKTLSLGTEYFYGQSKGRLCYFKKLKYSIARWTGLKHKQIVRYLREFEKAGLIYIDDQQISLDGKVRPQYFLSESAYLRVKPGDKYLKLNMRGCGIKGFDIYGYLEQCIKEDSNPRCPDQLEFNICRSTRAYRSKTQRDIGKKRKRPQKASGSVQVMTPIKKNNPDPFYRKVQKTTQGQETNKNICIIHDSIKLFVPWWKTRLIRTEHVKVCCGIPIHEKAVWYKGKVYKLSSQGYKFLSKRQKAFRPKSFEHSQSVCSAKQTRQRMMSELSFNQSELMLRLKRDNERRFKL